MLHEIAARNVVASQIRPAARLANRSTKALLAAKHVACDGAAIWSPLFTQQMG